MSVSASSHREGNLFGLAMLISGTFSTVIMKTEYGVRAHGTELCADPNAPPASGGNGSEPALTTLCPFDKPWFGVLQMKLAMALVLVFLYLRKAATHSEFLATPLARLRKDGKKYMNTPEVAAMSKKRQTRHQGSSSSQESQPLLSHPSANTQEAQVSLKTMAAVALPSLLDLLQTVLANVGLLWISSSVYQMARGSVIIFSAVFSVKLMGKRLYAYHYTSILVVAVSVVLVGWAGVGHNDNKSATSTKSQAESDEETWNALLGLGFIIAAQVLCALQIVVEEHMMVALDVSPMLLVGLEGLWGLVFYVVLIPVLTLTPASATGGFSKIWHEDFYDSFVKVGNSPTLVALIVVYIVAVGTLNVTANYVTKHLSAVMRSIAEVRNGSICLERVGTDRLALD